MPLNFLNPMWTRTTYVGNRQPHHMTLCVSPVGTPTPGISPAIFTKAGATVDLETAFHDFFVLFADMFSPTHAFGLTEVFYALTPDDPPAFIYAFDLGLPGTAGVEAPVDLSRLTFTFKTLHSGTLRLVGLEANIPVNEKIIDYSALEPFESPVVDYMLSDDCVITGRDNAYPLVWQSFITKTDDRLRKAAGLA